jgi:lipopolysaccharide transport system permease protein
MNKNIYVSQRNLTLKLIFIDILKGLSDGKELGFRLFLKDLKSSYEKSILGYVWIILPPFVTAGIWILLNQQQIIKVTNTPMIYTAYCVCGTTLWSLFVESVNKPLARYRGAIGMMVKLNFPRESLLVASFYDLLFSIFIKTSILIPLLWYLGYAPGLHSILGILAMIVLVFIGVSIGIFLTPFGLMYNDVSRIINLGLPFFMFITPVVYPLANGNIFSKLQNFNPISAWLEYSRSLFGNYEVNSFAILSFWLFISFILIIFGLIILRITLPIIVERSGS